MNILQAIYQYQSGGGSLQVVRDLAEAARAAGHSVTVLARTPSNPIHDSPDGRGIERFFTGNKIWDAWRLAQRMYHKPYDIVHVHDRYCSLLISLIPQAPPSVQTNHVAYRNHRHLTRFAQCVVGCSQGMDRHHAEFFGLPASRRALIPNGVNFRLPNLETVQRLKDQLPECYRKRRICLTVARLEFQKGHSVLIEAIAHLPSSLRAQWCFVLAGEGSLAASLREQAERLRVQEAIYFLGHTASVPEWLHLAEAFVLPSRYEGLPLALLEAMAAGLPCAATDIDGNREALRHNENGLLAQVEDAHHLSQVLGVLLADPYLQRRLGARAQEDYRSFWTFDRTWQAYEALYERLRQPLKPGIPASLPLTF